MSGKVHSAAGGDSFVVESGGQMLIESGGRLVAEAGSLVEIMPRWKTFPLTTHAISPLEAGVLVKTTNSNPVSITVPPGIALAAPVTVHQLGAGQVTFVEGSGVNIRTPETLKIAKQGAAVTLSATDIADEYVLAGYLERTA
ncbi:hypothetical protein [Mesorhizobium huakuii]|uniref:Uncharacterized protein n=1 Tax=Mesorhizobium huakuii TaxID=28104 RepID=A0A7G6SZC1_9HYPH|nr:hypothetical protein [Mesorhizobium huakuii]QND59853.1 hypothetical protein HB778_27320 [Mesorhizobium huakuii]